MLVGYKMTFSNRMPNANAERRMCAFSVCIKPFQLAMRFCSIISLHMLLKFSGVSEHLQHMRASGIHDKQHETKRPYHLTTIKCVVEEVYPDLDDAAYILAELKSYASLTYSSMSRDPCELHIWIPSN